MGRKANLQKKYKFSSGVVINNSMYFFTERENVLMEMDLRSLKIKYSKKFVDCNRELVSGTDSLRSLDNRIFRLDLSGKYLEEFSLEEKKYKKVEININDKDWGNFVAVEVMEPFIYIFPRWRKEVIKISLNSYEVETIFLKKNQIKFNGYSTAYRDGNKIWLFETGNKNVEIFDMEKDMSIKSNLPDEIQDCISVCKGENALYILTSYNQIYIWKQDEEVCNLMWRGKECYKSKKYFRDMILIQKNLILLPFWGIDVVIVNCEDNKDWVYITYPKDFTYDIIKGGKYLNRFEDNNCFYYPMRVSNYIMKINKNNGRISWEKPEVPSEEEQCEFWKLQKSLFPEIMEDNLSKIIFGENLRKKEEANNKKIGYIIWENAAKLNR